jgi:hypothetical protein
MPSFYNLPQQIQNNVVQSNTQYQQLPFYLVMNEVRTFQKWNWANDFFGTIDWQANQGEVMRATTPQRSPVGRSFFFPNNITVLPKKDIYTVGESYEEARVKRHNYESFQFNFNPSFTIFWRDYLKFANSDIAEQIARSNNQFVETNLYFNAPNVWFGGTGLLTGTPTGASDDTYAIPGSKTAAWLVANTTLRVTSQGLTLRNVSDAMIALQEDLAAPAFENVRNMPKDNTLFQNKYVLITSSEAVSSWRYDPDVAGLKSIQLDLLFSNFQGSLFGNLTYKINRYPVRFNTVDVTDNVGTVLWQAGFPIDPEVYDTNTQKWRPNPYYVSLISAPYEIAWLLGADVCKTIKVGPPPREFANTDMSQEKFYSLKWNGEIRLTDQVLVQYPNGTYDLNHYGEQLKFISSCLHGYLVGEPRNGFPIIFQRIRPILNPA